MSWWNYYFKPLFFWITIIFIGISGVYDILDSIFKLEKKCPSCLSMKIDDDVNDIILNTYFDSQGYKKSNYSDDFLKKEVKKIPRILFAEEVSYKNNQRFCKGILKFLNSEKEYSIYFTITSYGFYWFKRKVKYQVEILDITPRLPHDKSNIIGGAKKIGWISRD